MARRRVEVRIGDGVLERGADVADERWGADDGVVFETGSSAGSSGDAAGVVGTLAAGVRDARGSSAVSMGSVREAEVLGVLPLRDCVRVEMDVKPRTVASEDPRRRLRRRLRLKKPPRTRVT